MFYVHQNAGWGWGWWVLMTLGMIAFWALVIYGVVWLVRGRDLSGPEQARPAPPEQPEQPEQILKRRLAQGEISIDEYERLLAVLQRPSPRRASAGDGQSTASDGGGQAAASTGDRQTAA